MSKPPEEGQIWEWRGFGKISPEIAAHVESLPIRNGIRDLPGTDVYLIPPASDADVLHTCAVCSGTRSEAQWLSTRASPIQVSLVSRH